MNTGWWFSEYDIFFYLKFVQKSGCVIEQLSPCCSCIFFIASLFTSLLQAQINTAGKIVSYQKNTNGISGSLANGIFKIDIYNANIIRVRVKQNGTFRDFSYALADTTLPSFTDWSISEKENIIYLETNTIKLQVEKAPHFA
jgi:hypothetical protein